MAGGSDSFGDLAFEGRAQAREVQVAVDATELLAQIGQDPRRGLLPARRRGSQELRGTSSITRASGKSHIVLARVPRHHRLSDALFPVGRHRPHQIGGGTCALNDAHRAREPYTTAPYAP